MLGLRLSRRTSNTWAQGTSSENRPRQRDGSLVLSGDVANRSPGGATRTEAWSRSELRGVLWTNCCAVAYQHALHTPASPPRLRARERPGFIDRTARWHACAGLGIALALRAVIMRPIEHADRAGRILLVDDDVDSRDMLQCALERDGHRVATANGGMEGLEVAREFRPDVAFVGIMGAGLDGHAVASAMRRDLGSGVWIIALRALPERRARSWGSGFNLHLRGTVEPRTIKAIVGAALNGRVTARS